MALIRHSAADRASRDAIALDLGDLSRQGDALRTRARAEADAIVREARSERDRLLRDAAEVGRAQGAEVGRAEGKAQGLEQGRAEALARHAAELERVTAGWSAALDAFTASREQLLSEGRTDAVRLALALAERITGRVIAADPAVAASQMEKVLAQVSRRTRLRLAVHPQDEAVAREALPGVMRRATCVEHCELVTDDSLSRGSCLAGTPGGGVIDATIETQIARIAAALIPEPDSAPPSAISDAAEASS